MPPLVPYQSRTQSPVPRGVEPMGDVFGGVERTIDLFDRIQRASDMAEAANLSQTGKAGITGAIQIADSDEQDPDGFKNRAINDSRQIYETTLGRARNARVRQLTQDALADNMIQASTAIQLTYKQKQVRNAKGQSFEYLQGAERELSLINDPVKRIEKEKEMADHLRDTRQAGVWTPLESATLANGILERDAYLRAYNEIDTSLDPINDFKGIQQRYPNLDPKQLVSLMNQRDQRNREVERMKAEAEKRAHQEAVLLDTMDAVSGQMSTTAELNARAKARRYTPEEYRTMLKTMESGGVTNPQVATSFELAIREGKLTDYNQIANSRDLDKGEKSRLMGMIKDTQGSNHFSKSPEYSEAAKELRLAVSRKGPMESLDPKEQQMLLAANRELYDRVGKGENPIMVGREIQTRITPPTQSDKPNFQPRYKSEAELIADLKAGRISRDDAAAQALLLKQWQEYAERLQQKATQPAQPSQSRQRR